MTISLKADAGGTFGEILVNGSQVAKFTPGGNAVIAGLVGTVSQSGGIPTGAVIETGSNANGRFVRFADGTQICYSSTKESSSSGAATWTYPAAFSSGPTTTCIPRDISARSCALDSVGITTSVTFSAWSIGSSPFRVSIGVELVAIGRWF